MFKLQLAPGKGDRVLPDFFILVPYFTPDPMSIHLADYKLEVDKGKLATVANLES